MLISTERVASTRRLKRIYGRLGAACWLVILPAKLSRYFGSPLSGTFSAAAPSLFGPAGLLLVLLSSEGRLSRLTIPQACFLSAGIGLAVEFAQLAPVMRRLYRFDWLDVAATIVSAVAGAVLATVLKDRLPPAQGRRRK